MTHPVEIAHDLLKRNVDPSDTFYGQLSPAQIEAINELCSAYTLLELQLQECVLVGESQ